MTYFGDPQNPDQGHVAAALVSMLPSRRLKQNASMGNLWGAAQDNADAQSNLLGLGRQPGTQGQAPTGPYGDDDGFTHESWGANRPAPHDPSSELAQPGDPGYGAANVADNVAAHVIGQAANARARNDPNADSYLNQLAGIAWQREAAANGNPSGDTSAPQSYIDSWKGMLGAGEDTGKLGSAYQAATANARQRAQAEQALAAQNSASQYQQGAEIRQMAPSVANTAAQTIGRRTNPPQSAAPTPGEPGGPPLTNQYQPLPTAGRGGNMAERGGTVTPDDMVYRNAQSPTGTRQNYSSTTNSNDDNLYMKAMAAGRGLTAASVPPSAAAPTLGQGQDLSAPPPAGPAPKPGGDYHEYARAVAQQYGLNPDIFERQITQESGWKPNAKSGVGAQGLGQFMPETAKQYGVDVNDPYSSLDGAARYMRDNLKANNGSYRLALAAYNAGQGNVNKYGEGVFDDDFAKGQTRDYINIIMGQGAAARRGT